MFDAYKRYFDFQGRANRKEYWLFVLVYFIQVMAAVLIDSIVFGTALGQGLPITYFLVLALNIIPAISVSMRRLHDTNRTGWWLLISLIPIIGAIVFFIFTLLPGTPGVNRFGAQPGAAELEETFA
jgi:uncharacterized membrane protein YhaH (DUF805 family)